VTLPTARPRVVLFDWDGTLVDNWPVIHGALNDTLAEWGLPTWTIQEAMARISRSQRDSFPTIFGEGWERARDAFYGRFAERHLHELTVLPGAPALLDRLMGYGIAMGVVSNKAGGYLRAEVSHLGWERYFIGVVGAGDAVEDKPSALPVRLVLGDAADDDPAGIWFVGDSATDLLTARNAGCVSVLVRHASANPAPLPVGLEPDHEVADLEALGALVPGDRGAI